MKMERWRERQAERNVRVLLGARVVVPSIERNVGVLEGVEERSSQPQAKARSR